MSPEESSPDQTQSRFTAVNGRSSPGAKTADGTAVTNGSDSHSSPELQRRESQSSLGKRKRSNSITSNGSKRVASGSDEQPPDQNSSPWTQSRHQSEGEHQSEAQLADMLRSSDKNTDSIEGTPRRESAQSQQNTPQTNDGTPVQVQPGMAAPLLQKQRKRNFSNRTKTGCLTCRERKKKCDEAKPTCNNCDRGGFRCKGYQQTSTVFRAPPVSHNLPLQAKNGSAFDFPHFQYGGGHRAPSISYMSGGHPSMGPGDPSDPSRSLPTPQEPHVRTGGYSRAWADDHQHPGGPFMSDSMGLNRHDLPPSFGMPDPHGRGPGQKTLPPPPPVLHPPSHPSHRGSASSAGPFNPISTAQLALQHGSSNRQPSMSMWRTEKEKMLNSVPYNPQDAQLKDERKQCAIACYKFNQNAADPQNLTDAERAARFRQIVEPRADKNGRSPDPKDFPTGHLGDRVTVEPPFNCEYGYNLHIGNDTEIGPNCRIYDGCRVKIGARCIIGPDVSFYATDGDHSTVPRPAGKKRDFISKPITIEDDVFIGGRAILLAGCYIEKGATVAAGTVVKGKDRLKTPFLGYNPVHLKSKGFWAERHSYSGPVGSKLDDPSLQNHDAFSGLR